jgi:NYN domain
MDLSYTPPEICTFVLVAGDSDYTPLFRRLRDFGKSVVGIGTETSADLQQRVARSEYRYWATLVAQVDPHTHVTVDAEFDLEAAEHLLRRVISWSASQSLRLN